MTKSDTTMAFVDLEDIYGSIEVIVFPKTLAENSPLLIEGAAVVVSGRLDIREDEPSKIVCEHIISSEKALSGKTAVNEEPASAESSKKKRRGLFLKFPNKDCPELIQAEKLLAIFDGNTPLYYYFADTKEYKKLDLKRFVDVNEPLINELRRVLGDGNVVLQ